MRDIKFRMWTGEEMRHSDGHWVGSSGHVCIGKIYTGYETSDEWEDYKLMQYTGLKDKNGTPIYEDDILDCYTSDVPCIVTWYGSEWGMWWVDESYTDFDNFDTSRHCEIIGNRYENPELLEQ